MFGFEPSEVGQAEEQSLVNAEHVLRPWSELFPKVLWIGFCH